MLVCLEPDARRPADDCLRFMRNSRGWRGIGVRRQRSTLADHGVDKHLADRADCRRRNLQGNQTWLCPVATRPLHSRIAGACSINSNVRLRDMLASMGAMLKR